MTLAQIVNRPDLMPTPNTMDHLPARTPEQKALNKGKGGYSNLRESVINDLLPTPTVVDLGNNKTVDEWDAWTDEQREKHGNGNGHGASLSIETLKLMPTPRAGDRAPTTKEIDQNDPKKRLEVAVVTAQWGRFADAIKRWETVTGRTAPAPTQPDGKDGQHRLSPRFTEWMMGLPYGWITDVDITRNEQLKACGNGVVPQQAALALTQLLKGTNYVS